MVVQRNPTKFRDNPAEIILVTPAMSVVKYNCRDNLHKGIGVTKSSLVNFFFLLFYYFLPPDLLYFGGTTRNKVQIASNVASSYSIRRDLVSKSRLIE